MNDAPAFAARHPALRRITASERAANAIARTAFIVHGPAACGKTFHREAIAKLLTGDPTAYHDDELHLRQLEAGKVHLMQRRSRIITLAERFDGTVEIHKFADLKPQLETD